jgi:hypothetical protein
LSLKSGKDNRDYTERLRKSLRAGWYLYFFLPVALVASIVAYSIWMQWKYKILKGDFKAAKALFLATN